MTVNEYDEHINIIANFMLTVINATEKENDDTYVKLYEAIGAAYMALRRERVNKYGYMDDIYSEG